MIQTPKDFFDSLGIKYAKRKGVQVVNREDVEAALNLYAAHVSKEIRHTAAEIALTVGNTRTPEEAHRDIMNLQLRRPLVESELAAAIEALEPGGDRLIIHI
jgi:hypothetical protein